MRADSELFFGRTSIIHEIMQGALACQPASFSLVGPRLSGKSTLLQWLAAVAAPWSASNQEQPVSPLIILIDCAWVTPIDFFDQLWVLLATHQTLLDTARVEENGDNSFQRLWQLAQQLAATRQRLVLLLDNFDTLWHTTSVPLNATLQRLTSAATVVMATTQPFSDLAETAIDPTPFGAVKQIFLGLLECSAAQQWLAHYQQQYAGLEALGDELLTLTGRHPYLLRKLGDSLAEVQQMLTPGQHFASHHAPLIRLRLAEHARPLFVALWQRIEAHSGRLQPALYPLLDQLTRTPLSPAQVLREQTPALNWLINQVVIRYSEQAGGAVYQLFSPLFADFVIHRRLTALPTLNQAPLIVLSDSEHFYDQLSKMEVALLRYFEKHSQQLVTMEQLLAEVWKRPASSTRRVQEAIRRLRLQLEQQTLPIGVIENERGRGYRFIPAHGQN